MDRSVATLFPHLLEMWSSENEISLQTLTPGSNYQGIWICSLSPRHRWRASVMQITGGSGCPYCAGQRVDGKVNSLLARNPLLATQWSTKNLLKSDEVTARSNHRVFWACQFCHHEWGPVSPKQRSHAAYFRCPACKRAAELPPCDDVAVEADSIIELHNDDGNPRVTKYDCLIVEFFRKQKRGVVKNDLAMCEGVSINKMNQRLLHLIKLGVVAENKKSQPSTYQLCPYEYQTPQARTYVDEIRRLAPSLLNDHN